MWIQSFCCRLIMERALCVELELCQMNDVINRRWQRQQRRRKWIMKAFMVKSTRAFIVRRSKLDYCASHVWSAIKIIHSPWHSRQFLADFLNGLHDITRNYHYHTLQGNSIPWRSTHVLRTDLFAQIILRFPIDVRQIVALYNRRPRSSYSWLIDCFYRLGGRRTMA